MKNERMKLEIMYAIEDLRNLLIASGDESDVIDELEKQNRKLRTDKSTLREITYILSEQNRNFENMLRPNTLEQLQEKQQ